MNAMNFSALSLAAQRAALSFARSEVGSHAEALAVRDYLAAAGERASLDILCQVEETGAEIHLSRCRERDLIRAARAIVAALPRQRQWVEASLRISDAAAEVSWIPAYAVARMRSVAVTAQCDRTPAYQYEDAQFLGDLEIWRAAGGHVGAHFERMEPARDPA
jgi:hypothetical protein